MALSRFCSAPLVLALAQVTGGTPPWTADPTGQQTAPKPSENRFPVDDPQKASPSAKPTFDVAQAKHDAEELVKQAEEIPSRVDQANKGVISKELNDRLKRIEKLSKQLRRERFP